LTGSSSLEIRSIEGVASANSQNVTIDASQLSGNLTLDATGIADSSAGGPTVSISTGSGVSYITENNQTESINVSIGAGQTFVKLGAGTDAATISGIKAMDQITIGAGNALDVFTNGMKVLAPHQAAIDSSGSLTAAAALAAEWAENSAPHQALLFSYKGNTYVFIDASGSHAFDSTADAIIQVMGVAATADLSGVFHSV